MPFQHNQSAQLVFNPHSLHRKDGTLQDSKCELSLHEEKCTTGGIKSLSPTSIQHVSSSSLPQCRNKVPPEANDETLMRESVAVVVLQNSKQ